MAVLGPYYVAENKAGAYLLLKRNPNYWKHDQAGQQLPYIDSVKLDIQQNRDIEALRLKKDVLPAAEYLSFTVSGINFDHNRVSDPGMITGGSFYGSRA